MTPSAAYQASPVDPVVSGTAAAPTIASMRDAILAKLAYAVGKNAIAATERDWFVATALAVRDQITERWINSIHKIYVEKRKRVYYLSLEEIKRSIRELGFEPRQRNVYYQLIDETPPRSAVKSTNHSRALPLAAT